MSDITENNKSYKVNHVIFILHPNSHRVVVAANARPDVQPSTEPVPNAPQDLLPVSTATTAISTTTMRGNPAVLIEKQLYVKKIERKNWTTYRCSQYFKNCKSVCQVDSAMKIIKAPSAHNHELIIN